jgi:hypothetical protein
MLMEDSSVVEPSPYKPLLPVVDRKGSVMIRLRRRMASRRLWCILVKQGTVKRCVGVLLAVSVVSIFFYTHYLVSTFSR